MTLSLIVSMAPFHVISLHSTGNTPVSCWEKQNWTQFPVINNPRKLCVWSYHTHSLLQGTNSAKHSTPCEAGLIAATHYLYGATTLQMIMCNTDIPFQMQMLCFRVGGQHCTNYSVTVSPCDHCDSLLVTLISSIVLILYFSLSVTNVV